MRKILTLGIAVTAIVAGQALAASQPAQMHVSVEVVARTILTLDSQPASVEITASDIARGYVDLPSAVSFHVRSNARNGFAVEFQPVGGPFSGARVSWGNTMATVGSDSSWIAQPYQQGTTTGVMSVRFTLAPDATPGTYGWPLAVAADSL